MGSGAVLPSTPTRKALLAVAEPLAPQVPFIRLPADTAMWDVQGTMDEVMNYYKNHREALDKDNYDHSQYALTEIKALGANRALVDQI